ncbi:MAG TPA: succinate dehydrogenase, cytochrome b556 subunit [Burkholderiaceae bacterium]|nr:succinate dehydrogenase, cytochrome b556 subunit [Burkholderiaceae bacterium]
MTEPTDQLKPNRPEFRNIHAIKDLTTYRMPAAAIVSILHRASGAILFLLLPLIAWAFGKSILSEVSYASLTSVFGEGVSFIPGWFFKLMAIAVIWSFLHHICAGLRHLVMDLDHSKTSKSFGKSSAQVVFGISLLLTLVLGAKVFGFY